MTTSLLIFSFAMLMYQYFLNRQELQ